MRIQQESKTLTNELRKNKEFYGGADIFTKRNIDLVNKYIASMEAYSSRNLNLVNLVLLLFFIMLTNFYIVESKGLSSESLMVKL